ncbi:unnamed protein product [Adineta steineri]|uniref:Uncharacterized protein n=1 Tax=Adineta steineri TaxID=433720 RepID=A0A815H3R0_9BILA|nr:unnamed protein product [Adineta steineri]CAF4088544.1 unnamed protein product [Adineta steineri]
MFLCSISGISFFAYVRNSASPTDLFNCETFPNSMTILLQIYTTAGWLGLFQALKNDQQPDCDLTIKLSSNNEPPLRLSKLNQFLFVVMNLLICENDRMHCIDILNALTKIFLSKPDILGKNSERDDPSTDIKKDRRKVYYPVTTALEWQRETYLLKGNFQKERDDMSFTLNTLRRNQHDRESANSSTSSISSAPTDAPTSTSNTASNILHALPMPPPSN